MYNLLYKVNVEKKCEYTVKTIIDVIWGINCKSTGKGQLYLNLYANKMSERNRIKDQLNNLPYVYKVEAM